MPEGVGYGTQSTASVGLNLNVVGNHAYAYTGLKSAVGSAVDQIKFRSGNYTFVGRLYCNGAVTAGNSNGQSSTFTAKLNGLSVALIRTRTSTDDSPSTIYNDIIIPPYTDVAITVQTINTAAETTSVLLVGKIFRKTD